MTQDLFTIKPMNQWIEEAASRPDPRSLFGDFWLEGELAVLFSDTGRGKSLLGVQIADSIARGRPIGPVPMTAKPRKVLYFDFEFSAKQFEMRYSAPSEDAESPKDSYRFPKNFHRAEPALAPLLGKGGVAAASADGVVRKPAELAELAELADAIRASRAKVVVIDSMAWLQGPNITARHTVPLIRELKRLQSALGLSILVLAHNPRRDTSRPLSISGLHGAGVICNFADSVFALGQSRIDTSFRYIKHIKSRSTELTCDENNVLVGEVRKWKKNFLSFRFHRFSPESDHLVRELNPMIEERALMIKEMSEERGMTQRDIASKLGISLGSVNRYLQMARPDEDYFDLDDGFDLDDEDNSEAEPAEPVKLAEPVTCRSPRVAKRRSKCALLNADSEIPSIQNPKSKIQNHPDSPPARGGVAADARVVKVSNESAELDPVSSPRASKGTELNKLPELPEPVYKTLDDQIEVGDIVRNRNGLLMKRTFWGWDRCADSLK